MSDDQLNEYLEVVDENIDILTKEVEKLRREAEQRNMTFKQQSELLKKNTLTYESGKTMINNMTSQFKIHLQNLKNLNIEIKENINFL